MTKRKRSTDDTYARARTLITGLLADDHSDRTLDEWIRLLRDKVRGSCPGFERLLWFQISCLGKEGVIPPDTLRALELFCSDGPKVGGLCGRLCKGRIASAAPRSLPLVKFLVWLAHPLRGVSQRGLPLEADRGCVSAALALTKYVREECMRRGLCEVQLG